jgi:hypothetical protein
MFIWQGTDHFYNRIKQRFGIKNKKTVRSFIRKFIDNGTIEKNKICYNGFIVIFKLDKDNNVYIFLTIYKERKKEEKQ